MSETMGIYKKMLNVMKGVGYLQKDDKISYGTTSYKGLSEEKITGVVREKLVEQGIIVYPIIQSHSREGNLSTVDTTYRFVDTEDGSYIDAVSSGTGADTQDKGVGKAMTYSFKYLFLRTFAIPTGEDPDKISSAELDDRDKAHRVSKGRITILQLFEDHPELSEDYRASITMDVDTAVSKEDAGMLEIIYKEVMGEIRKTNAPEQKVKTHESAKAAAAELAKKYHQEPPLPDIEPDGRDVLAEIAGEELF